MDSDVLWTALEHEHEREGVFPFLSPGGWRKTFQRLLALQDGQLRFFGLCSILIGLGLLWFVS